LGSCRDVILKLIEDPRIQNGAVSTLLHPELHARNIYVFDKNPAIITAFADWQSSNIELAFKYADEVPDFAAPIPDPPEDNISPEDQRARDNADLCYQAFDAAVKGLVPKLSAARALDKDILQLFLYCDRTYRDGAMVLRQALIEISKRWKELGLPDSCPYPLPTSKALLVHQKDLDTFETAQKLKHNLMSLLDTPSDGWVPTHLWGETNEFHEMAFEVHLQEIQNAERGGDHSMSEQKLRESWPFDIPQSN
jgi:hypothetical protein